MNNIKTAALSYYADNVGISDFAPESPLPDEALIPYLKKVSQNKNAANTFRGYKVIIDDWNDWYVCCNIDTVTGSSNKNNAERSAILRKLEGKAESIGLEFSKKNDSGNARSDKAADSTYIYLWIR